jgi:AcrR family transcriptional regulator
VTELSVDSALDPLSHPMQATRRQILSRASELFLAKGYRGVSMKEIAEAVRVTPAALYYHFPKGKEALFTTMIQTVFVDDGLAGVERVVDTAPGLRERLTLLSAALLALPLDERLSTLLRDAREHIADPENQRVILSLRDRIKRLVLDLFRAARDAGEIREDVPVELLVGLYVGMLRESGSLSGSRHVRELVTVLLDGIAPPARAKQ